MFFLIRSVFWIVVVLWLMPSERGGEPARSRAVKSEAAATPTASPQTPIAEVALFCARNTATCRDGAVTAARLGKGLGSAAGSLSSLWQSLTDPAPTGSLPVRGGAAAAR